MTPRRRSPLVWLAAISYERFVWTGVGLVAVLWLALAIQPRYRSVWLLENAPFLAFAVALAFLHRRLPLSRVSFACIFLFCSLHLVGAHYSYAEVPYREWARALFGLELDHERNHFDRLVHFSYGLLFAYPARELFLRVAAARGFWGYFLPLDVVLSTSLVYELLEWASAVVFADGPSRSFVADQGDPWDAQKDMALAALGALVAMTATAVANLRMHRDFAREWTESLRTKRAQPLGEEAVARSTRTRR